MTRQVDFLLVGVGLASATAAETLRLEGADSTIAIFIGGSSPAISASATVNYLGRRQKSKCPFTANIRST